MREIRVLVVDDSAFLRRNIPLLLESDSDIKVIGTAANGAEAVEMAARLKPDVITLDIIMPVMDGLTALRRIMKENPTPVVMLSSLTYEGARQTMEALSLGAVDFITKPSGTVSLDIAKIRSEIVETVKIAATAGADITRQRPDKVAPGMPGAQKGAPQATTAAGKARHRKELVAIATSTGGPAALPVVLGNLPGDLPVGVVIVQHIAEGFTEALAERLDGLSPLHIKVSRDFEEVVPGTALLAPAGMHLTVKRVEGKLYAALSKEPSASLHRPSADVLFASVAKVCGVAACAVIMTGMGDDGARGIREIRDRGGVTIAQDEATSVIFGMPREAIKGGGIDLIVPLDRIAGEIIHAL
jgi:two-component system chemotaxis response regulator CheB